MMMTNIPTYLPQPVFAPTVCNPCEQLRQNLRNKLVWTKPNPTQNDEIIYKLYDFDGNKENNLVRLIFSYAGVNYKYKKVRKDEWNRVKSRIPIQQLPILRVQRQLGIYYRDVILRYLAREFDLMGSSNRQQATVEMIVGFSEDFRKNLFKQIENQMDIEQRTKVLNQFLIDSGHNYLNQLENFYETFHSQGPFYLNSQMSLADLIAHETINYFVDIQPKLLDNYPHLRYARYHMSKCPQLTYYFNEKSSTKKRHRTEPPKESRQRQQRRRSYSPKQQISRPYRTNESSTPKSIKQKSFIDKAIQVELPIVQQPSVEIVKIDEQPNLYTANSSPQILGQQRLRRTSSLSQIIEQEPLDDTPYQQVILMPKFIERQQIQNSNSSSRIQEYDSFENTPYQRSTPMSKSTERQQIQEQKPRDETPYQRNVEAPKTVEEQPRRDSNTLIQAAEQKIVKNETQHDEVPKMIEEEKPLNTETAKTIEQNHVDDTIEETDEVKSPMEIVDQRKSDEDSE